MDDDKGRGTEIETRLNVNVHDALRRR